MSSNDGNDPGKDRKDNVQEEQLQLRKDVLDYVDYIVEGGETNHGMVDDENNKVHDRNEQASSSSITSPNPTDRTTSGTTATNLTSTPTSSTRRIASGRVVDDDVMAETILVPPTTPIRDRTPSTQIRQMKVLDYVDKAEAHAMDLPSQIGEDIPEQVQPSTSGDDDTKTKKEYKSLSSSPLTDKTTIKERLEAVKKDQDVAARGKTVEVAKKTKLSTQTSAKGSYPEEQPQQEQPRGGGGHDNRFIAPPQLAGTETQLHRADQGGRNPLAEPGAYAIYPTTALAIAAIDTHDNLDTGSPQREDSAGSFHAPSGPDAPNNGSTVLDAQLATVGDDANDPEVQARLNALTVTASSVIPYNPRQQGQGNDRKKMYKSLAGGIILFAVVIACLVIFLGGGSGDEDKPISTVDTTLGTVGDDGSDDLGLTEDTSLPTISPLVLARQILAPISNIEVLHDQNSPQYKAMLWLIDDTDPVAAGFDARLESTSSSRGVFHQVDSLDIWIERYIVAVFYYSTGGPSWYYNLGFLSNRTVCSWTIGTGQLGVSCDAEGRVKSLTIVALNFNGTFPDEISSLQALEEFTVAQGTIRGTIPPSYGTLSRLNTIRLFELGYLTGPIPDTFGNLRRLKTLLISVCQLTGTIPSGIYQLSNLDALILSYNQLSGTIPELASSTTQPGKELTLHVLFGNQLTGTIPDWIYTPDVIDFFLFGNLLTGTISEQVGRLKRATSFHVADNLLSGTLPPSILELIQIEELRFSFNSFGGTIPNEISQLMSVQELSLEHNQFTGTVPLLPDLIRVRSINLSYNGLTGSMVEFCNELHPSARLITDCDSGGDGVINLSIRDCPCCVQCCDNTFVDPMGTGAGCSSNPQAICQANEAIYEYEHSVHYQAGANTLCECIYDELHENDSANGTSLDALMTCQDTSCQICNRDGSVCAINESYEHKLTNKGETERFKATYQYTVGLNDTVTFEWWSLAEHYRACEVTLNGQTCRHCGFMTCYENSFDGYVVDCDNLGGEVGTLTIDICDRNKEDSGPLTIFALQDPFFLNGCPPRIWI